MDRQLFSVLAPDVRKALDLSLPQVGLAATVFTLGMGLAGLPTGWLLQRMGRRTVSLIGLVVFSVATLLTAYSHGLYDLLAYRFVSGLGEAMQLTAILAIGTTYFLHHRAVAASSLNFTFGIGAVLGPNIGAAILGATHWQMPFVVFGLAGIPVLLLILLFVKPWFTETQAGSQTAVVASDVDAADRLLAPVPMVLALATVFAGLSIYGYLGLYPTYEDHPFGALQEAGVRVTLASDDPPYFGCSIGSEYAVAQQRLGNDEEQLKDVTRIAVEASFAEDAVKEDLHARLDFPGDRGSH